MIVGLLFIAIIWCLHEFLSYKQVVHNSCNMGTCGLPDTYALGPAALMLLVYILGKPLVPMLQLYSIYYHHVYYLGILTACTTSRPLICVIFILFICSAIARVLSKVITFSK